jgi:hypothetical protein
MTPLALLLAISAATTDSVAPGPITDSVKTPVVSDSTARIAAPVEQNPSIAPNPTDSATAKPTVSVAPVPAGPVVIPSPPAGPVGFAGPAGPMGPVVNAGPTIIGPSMIVQIDTSGSGTSARSTPTAVGLSLLLPGWGHRYLGYKGRATPYFATDLVGWVALFGAYATGRSALSNAAELANRYAGAQLGSNPDPSLLAAMRTYRSRRQLAGRNDSYNQTMVLSGKNPEFEFPDDDAHNWDWGTREYAGSDEHIRSFESQVRLWRGTQVAIYSTAGALVLVRLVAAMDVLRLNRSAASRAGISLETRPVPGGMDATLAVNF